ncbi:MAG: hypothetical protein AABZ55_09650, partial [Bdellovibrionota bacterium]
TVCSLSACKSNPLEDFVSRNVEIESTKGGELVGHLNFTHTQYYNAVRRVCDRALCGYDNEWQCHYDRVCYTVDHGVVCRGSSNTCKQTPGSVIHHCENVRECGYVAVPRYCDVNCHNENYIDSNTTTQTSPVRVQVRERAGARVDLGTIKGLWLGVKTNSRFLRAMDDPSLRPEDYSDLFNQLNKTDKTIMVLSAKGYRLVSGQSFLKLPAVFKGGDPATVELVVEATGTNKEVTSVLGTTEDFPALESSSGPN